MVVYDRIIPNSALSSLVYSCGGRIYCFHALFHEDVEGVFSDKAGRGIENESSADVFQKIVDLTSKHPSHLGFWFLW